MALKTITLHIDEGLLLVAQIAEIEKKLGGHKLSLADSVLEQIVRGIRQDSKSVTLKLRPQK